MLALSLVLGGGVLWVVALSLVLGGGVLWVVGA